MDQTFIKGCNFFLILLIWIPGSLTRGDEIGDLQARIKSAVDQYALALKESNPSVRIGAFRKAEVAFASVLEHVEPGEGKRPKVGANLYVSWGNAAIQSENPGVAVLAFRRALLLEPNHRQAQNNLDYVRSQLPKWTQNPGKKYGPVQRFFFWSLWLGAPRVQLFSAVAFMVASLLMALSIWFSSVQLRWACVLPGLVWVVLVASSFYNAQPVNEKMVVFVADETQARSADSLNAPKSFATKIPCGTEATIVESRDDWTRVEFGDRKQGWVQNSSVRFIR
ncbi:MAG: hypothetical protein VX438_14225 [Planctomycetota bacterium]|nr:hypothetical protein [Planctomycetota bacterium]